MHHMTHAPSSNLPLYTWTAVSRQYNTEAILQWKKSHFIQSEIYKQFSVSNLRLPLWIFAVRLPMQQPNSCIFKPCDLLPTFPLLHIPALHFWPYRIFHCRIFSRPRPPADNFRPIQCILFDSVFSARQHICEPTSSHGGRVTCALLSPANLLFHVGRQTTEIAVLPFTDQSCGTVFQPNSDCWTFHSQCSGNDWKCSCSRITVIMQQLTWRICCTANFAPYKFH